ncbi:MAG: molybdopterin-dependent oxidoreductase [Gemmatimonadetes bacterium]|nr:molybdopterin-dependent oxidoreductase [Gemmatimonadota bacterium]
MSERGRRDVSRRRLLGLAAAGAGGLVAGRLASGWAQVAAQTEQPLPGFSGPGPNPFWNSVGPLVPYPQKLPLIRLTDRPVQLETPRHYCLGAFTPNPAFYVRWHLDAIPNAVDLARWRLVVEGQVKRPLRLSLDDLLRRFPSVSVAAANQCSGNSRSRFQPRVAGGQWGNGAMGNATWNGVRLADVLAMAGVQPGAVQVQFEGLDRGRGPEGLGSHRYLKSLDAGDAALEQALLAYSMNGEPLPMLNGFPLRLVLPGYFATYWVKALGWIRVLGQRDENFWMRTAYRIPDTPRGATTPEAVAGGQVRFIPIHRMPVRSFLITPDGSAKIPAGLPVVVRGIAFSGYGRVTRVDVSADDGRSWQPARLGPDHGEHSFREWSYTWRPERPGAHVLAVRAADAAGNTQPDEPVWNPGGYLWNRIERQEVVVGPAA